MTKTRVMSISIGESYIDIHTELEKLKPQKQTMSSFINEILKEYINNNKVNYYQPIPVWNSYIGTLSGESYKQWYEHLNKLNILEKQHTIRRIEV